MTKKKDETPFIPAAVGEDIIDGTGNVGRFGAFLAIKLFNATANIVGKSVAYAGEVVNNSKQNASLVHQAGHKALAAKHCTNCGTQLPAVAKFCSNCGQKQ